MKNKHNSRGIIRAVFVTLWIAPYVVFFVLLFDKCKASESIKEIMQVYTCLAAVLSAAFSGVAIFETRKQHIQDKQCAIFAWWYEEIVLKRHINSITDFFNKCLELVNVYQTILQDRPQITGAELDKRIEDEITSIFTPRYAELHKGLVRDLNLIDRQLGKEISELMGKFQDEFFAFFTATNVDKLKMRECVMETNSTIMKCLLDFNKQITKTNALEKWIDE